VLSDRIAVKVTATQGSTFLDRMIALVEGASRQKTPNEIALGDAAVRPVAHLRLRGRHHGAFAAYSGTVSSAPCAAALFITLIPTTIGGLLSAIGIAGMDRLVRFNVLATSGRAVEAAGDVDAAAGQDRHHHAGDRRPVAFLPAPGV
jgi:K+-transporting ATPase ATPase B chain